MKRSTHFVEENGKWQYRFGLKIGVLVEWNQFETRFPSGHHVVQVSWYIPCQVDHYHQDHTAISIPNNLQFDNGLDSSVQFSSFDLCKLSFFPHLGHLPSWITSSFSSFLPRIITESLPWKRIRRNVNLKLKSVKERSIKSQYFLLRLKLTTWTRW
jgi:hypothetical protein